MERGKFYVLPKLPYDYKDLEPSGFLGDAIEKGLGSFERFKKGSSQTAVGVERALK